jgi:peptidoglycan/xylan/chitin deacetylase (PgdA/CDA1 family)
MAPLYGTQSGIREIVVTFDDGPHVLSTPKLLDSLARHQIKAVFFVLGKNLESPKGKEILKRMADEGHYIGNHTYSHPNLTKLPEPQIREEIEKTRELIGDLDRGIKLLRPPYGAHNELADRIVHELGYRLVFWNVDSLDWHPNYKSGKWVDHAMEQIRAREDSIVLAHDIHRTTVEKVEELIAGIKRLRNTTFPEFA